ITWLACAGFVMWLWFAPDRTAAAPDRSPLATFRARSATAGSSSGSSLAPASHRAREIAHWDVTGAGGLRSGLVIGPTTMLLTAPTLVYRLSLDPSSQATTLDALHSAIGRPA